MRFEEPWENEIRLKSHNKTLTLSGWDRKM